MPRLRLAICHLCQRKVDPEQTTVSEVTGLRYCRPVLTPGRFDRCYFIAMLRLHVPRGDAGPGTVPLPEDEQRDQPPTKIASHHGGP